MVNTKKTDKCEKTQTQDVHNIWTPDPVDIEEPEPNQTKKPSSLTSNGERANSMNLIYIWQKHSVNYECNFTVRQILNWEHKN